MDFALETVFRAAVWRSMHFAPLAVALGIAICVGVALLARR